MVGLGDRQYSKISKLYRKITLVDLIVKKFKHLGIIGKLPKIANLHLDASTEFIDNEDPTAA